jgi:NADH-quinone oxidoreductase subunit A
MISTPPSADYLTAHSAILVYLVAVIGFAFGGLIFWWLISPRKASEEKLTTYECGEDPKGSAWVQFNIRFYVFALIFLVFDVEAAFLIPWAVVFRELGPLAFLEGVVFILILVVALAWVRPEDRS